MSPIKDIEPTDPQSVKWQDWKTGGGSTEQIEEITSVYNQTLSAIRQEGAARLNISGENCIHGSPINEAGYWASVLRRRFSENEMRIGVKTESRDDGSVDLFIKLKT